MHNFVLLQLDSHLSSEHLQLDSRTGLIRCTSSSGACKNAVADLVLCERASYYWEIEIIRGSNFKIVVRYSQAIKKLAKAYSDTENGWAIYSTGQLRHKSHTTGLQFMEPFGPGDVIGVELNRIKGTLSFSKNRGQLKQAFEDKRLKQQGLLAAISCLLDGESFRLVPLQVQQ